MEDLSNYQKLRDDSLKFYNSIGKIFCPVLNDYVLFPSESFNHIVFKSARTERERPSQIMRFKLLPKAKKLVETSSTYQEFEETIQEFSVKSFKKKVQKSKVVRYWGIIAIIDSYKIKVIIRKVGDDGNFHFWSVVPAWVTNKYRDTKFISTMKGNPGED